MAFLKRVSVMASAMLGFLLIFMVIWFRYGGNPNEIIMILMGCFWLGVALIAIVPAKKPGSKAPHGKGVQLKPRKPK